jgi:outer membrane protein assembly factor BamB
MSDLAPLGVIALPAIAPLIALIQLLFPGLLGEHWKQYRAAIAVLLSQSTLMFGQWLATIWVPAESSWWLGPQALAWGLAAVAAIGFVASLILRPPAVEAKPAKIEFLALQGLGLASLVWLAWQRLTGASLLDQMLVIAAACLAGVLHLGLRRRWALLHRRPGFATESVFLLVMAAGGALLTHYLFADAAVTGYLADVSGEVTIFRSDVERSGSMDIYDPGPTQPTIIGQPLLPRIAGAVLLEAAPVVIEGKLFIGARRQIGASGYLLAASLSDSGELPPSETWRFGDWSTRAIFSSPALHQGYLYVGEGYHQHANCRLLCIDAQTGQLAWSFRTKSHVESPPTIVGEQIVFGAGDDGIYCLNLPQQKGDKPTIAWHYDSVHVDSSPLVVGDEVYAGGLVGDRVANLKFVALDRATGNKLWDRPAEISFPAAASYADGGVFLSLGNGKFSGEAAQPEGKVWRLSAIDGQKVWEFPLASSVLTSAVPQDGRVHFVAHNGECYGLDAATGDRLWKYDLGEEVVSSPVVSGGRMFVVSRHGSVVCLDAATGNEHWRFEELRDSTADVYSSPVLANGRLYVAIGAKVYCLGDATMRPL